MKNLLNNKWITVIITKLQVAPVELDVSSQSSSSCRASRARRVERVELCCSTSSTQPKCMASTRRMCRVESSRAKWNLSYRDDNIFSLYFWRELRSYFYVHTILGCRLTSHSAERIRNWVPEAMLWCELSACLFSYRTYVIVSPNNNRVLMCIVYCCIDACAAPVSLCGNMLSESGRCGLVRSIGLGGADQVLVVMGKFKTYKYRERLST